MTKSLKVGGSYKVFLPGESPWAECIAILPDGKWVGRILNTLAATSPELRKSIAEKFGTSEELPQLHKFSRDDLIIFEACTFDGVWNWMPISNQYGGGAA